MEMNLRKARTATFIAVVFAENVRAYTSRSFDRPFYENMFSNSAMQKAILIAQIALWIVVLVPGVSDKIFELEGVNVDAFGYGMAVVGALGCIVLCEIYKVLVKAQIATFRATVRREQEAEEEARQARIRNKVILKKMFF